MKFNNELFNEIVKANFEKGFEKVKNDYSGSNYWRVGHTSLNAIKCGCEGAGVDNTEHYKNKKEVLDQIKWELERDIRDILNGIWQPDQDITRIVTNLLLEG